MKLDAWRKENKMTRADVAAGIGVTVESVRQYEVMGRIPRPAIMNRITTATGGAVAIGDFYPAATTDTAESAA